MAYSFVACPVICTLTMRLFRDGRGGGDCCDALNKIYQSPRNEANVVMTRPPILHELCTKRCFLRVSRCILLVSTANGPFNGPLARMNETFERATYSARPYTGRISYFIPPVKCGEFSFSLFPVKEGGNHVQHLPLEQVHEARLDRLAAVMYGRRLERTESFPQGSFGIDITIPPPSTRRSARAVRLL